MVVRMAAAVASAATGKVEEPQVDAETTPPRTGMNSADDEPPAGAPDSAGKLAPQVPYVVACMPLAHCQIVSSLL
eukprot:COSAG02_NODE_24923_length_674_cov_0.638261_1_plen_74_part_01